MIFNKKISALAIAILLGFGNQCWAENMCKVDDNLIVRDIKYRISEDKLLSTTNIDVHSTNCVVALTGKAATDNEASRAIEIAISTPGVVNVITDNFVVDSNYKPKANYKITDSAHPFADAYITAKVKGVFLREKVFGQQSTAAMGIHVETKNGVVYLTGKSTAAQAKHAEELARAVDGVKRVEVKINQI